MKSQFQVFVESAAQIAAILAAVAFIAYSLMQWTGVIVSAIIP